MHQGQTSPLCSAPAGPAQRELSVRVDDVELLPLDEAVDNPLSHHPEAELDIGAERK